MLVLKESIEKILSLIRNGWNKGIGILESKKKMKEARRKADKYGFKYEEWKWLSMDIASPAHALASFDRVYLRLQDKDAPKDKRSISNRCINIGDILALYKPDVGLDNIAIYEVEDLAFTGGNDLAYWDNGYEYLLKLTDIIKAEDVEGLREYILDIEKRAKKWK